jgi:manganese/iron transport system permease protein/iron/zinc/copper transport system permease protein
MQILGVTLIAAALVIPAITARLITDSFNRLIVISTLLGSITGLAGMYLSYYIDVASGATIVLVQAAIFSFVLLITSLQKRSNRLMDVHI